MRLFECQSCGQPLFFENTACERCGHRLGFLPEQCAVTVIAPEGDVWRALAVPFERMRLCANAGYNVCNWLLRVDDPHAFCLACRPNRTIPDLSLPGNRLRWQKIELAKHQLFYTLLKLDLPVASEGQDTLAFQFLAGDTNTPVLTGHTDGLITINLAEADDAEREQARQRMGEPYRTLLGHFRHEIGHYYWDRLIAGDPRIDAFRQVFGDERRDYLAALARHYEHGPAQDWREQFITAYAGTHPWEDFAETWAHYLHMVDTLETAGAFGLRIRPNLAPRAKLTASMDLDPFTADFDRLISAWTPLTFAVNAINRSMGQPDLYPFVLGTSAIKKLRFVHELIHRHHRDRLATSTEHGHQLAPA